MQSKNKKRCGKRKKPKGKSSEKNQTRRKTKQREKVKWEAEREKHGGRGGKMKRVVETEKYNREVTVGREKRRGEKS